jgi:hypothetical protein
MDKHTKDLRELKKEVFDKGLNIYAMVNRLSNITNYKLDTILIERICREYLKQRHLIRNPWAWADKVFKLIRDNYYVESKAGEEKEVKKVNVDLMKQLFGGTKLGN